MPETKLLVDVVGDKTNVAMTVVKKTGRDCFWGERRQQQRCLPKNVVPRVPIKRGFLLH